MVRGVAGADREFDDEQARSTASPQIINPSAVRTQTESVRSAFM